MNNSLSYNAKTGTRKYSKTWKYIGETDYHFTHGKLYTDEPSVGGNTPTLYDDIGMAHYTPDYKDGYKDDFTEITFNQYYEQLPS